MHCRGEGFGIPQNCSISGQLLLYACYGEAGNSLALSLNRRSSRQIGRMTSLARIVEKLANFPGPVASMNDNGNLQKLTEVSGLEDIEANAT